MVHCSEMGSQAGSSPSLLIRRRSNGLVFGARIRQALGDVPPVLADVMDAALGGGVDGHTSYGCVICGKAAWWRMQPMSLTQQQRRVQCSEPTHTQTMYTCADTTSSLMFWILSEGWGQWGNW
jgi:DNA-directed RNA polymerase subunit RPC12/RpoP